MRYMTLCGVLLLATAARAYELDPSPELEARRNLLGLAVIPLTQGALAVDGERVLSPKLSVRLGVRLDARLFKGDQSDEWGDSSSFSVGLEPGLRCYLSGAAPEGLWVGSHLELSGRWSGLPPSHNQHLGVGMAALVGYSMVVSRGLTVQAGVGFGAAYSSTALRVVDWEDEFTIHSQLWGFAQRATLVVGWAF